MLNRFLTEARQVRGNRYVHVWFVCAVTVLSVIPGLSDGTYAQMADRSGIVVLSPAQTVVIEHQDRTNRLTRLSSFQAAGAPKFYEYFVKQSEHRVGSLPVDIPVLRVVFDTRVFFDFDKDIVRPEAERIIETVVESLRKEPPDVALFVAGHTDGLGTDAYNDDLGLRRARAVAQSLAAQRVKQINVYRVSFGKKVPIASNDTDQGRAQNRRVEFLFAAHENALAAWLITQKTVGCENRRGASGPDCRFIVEPETPKSSVAVAPGKAIASADTPKRQIEPEQPGAPVQSQIQEKRQQVVLEPKRYVIDLAEKRYEVEVVR